MSVQEFNEQIERIRKEIQDFGPGYPWWWLLDKQNALEGAADTIGWEAFGEAFDSLRSEPNLFLGSSKEWFAAGYNKKLHRRYVEEKTNDVKDSKG